MEGGGSTNERPGTDHVISGPMRGVEKTSPDGADRQTSRRTCRLYGENHSRNKIRIKLRLVDKAALGVFKQEC